VTQRVTRSVASPGVVGWWLGRVHVMVVLDAEAHWFSINNDYWF